MQESADDSCGEPPPDNPYATPHTIHSNVSTSVPTSFGNAISVLRSITNNPSVAVTTTSSNLSKYILDKITHETNLVTKSTQYTVTIHDGLTGSRAAVVDDTGPTIPEIDLRLFIPKILPCPPIVKKSISIFESLSTGSDPAYADGRWIAFPEDPGKTQEHETVVFGRLERVAKAVIEQAQLVSSVDATTRFRNDPDLVPEAKWRETGCRPDSFFVLRKRRSATVAHWADIAATGEFKRKDGSLRNIDDDSKKVLWNMHQTLREDPCRRFTYGFTIENRTMRIWFCSRAEILVSRPFDFIAQPLYLVRFFLAFTFAAEHEMGWDPTMKLVKDPNPSYIITVRSSEGNKLRFKTEGLLSSFGAEAIRGRATRVWKVKQWVGERAIEPPMVLKDCWIDSDRPCEGDVMEAIHASAKSKPAHAKVLEQGLLTKFAHGLVHVADGVIDCTIADRDGLLRGDKWFLFHRSDKFVKAFEKCKSDAANKDIPGAHRSLHDHLNNSVLKPITYHSKKHYRIVFRETCTTFADEKFLSGAFHMLSGVCTILKSLHAIGWVHRDISAGNIMVEKSTGVVKLADVEYAKEIGRSNGSGHHDARTGTLDFMSIEVATMEYLFLVRESDKEKSPRWFYNPIHDMESVWWLFAWTTLNRDIYFIRRILESAPDTVVPSSTTGVVTRSRQRKLLQPQIPIPGEDITADDDQIVPVGLAQESRATRVQRIKRQHAFALKLFVGQDVGGTRTHVVAMEIFLKKQLVQHDPLHPLLHILGDYLRNSRDLLADSYRKAEANLARLPGKANKVANKLHDQFKAIFDEANQCITGLGVEIGVRKLSNEHKKILEAETIAQKRWEAEHAAELARYDAETIHIIFEATDEESGSHDPPQPSSGRGKRRAAPSRGRPRKRVHTLPSVPEDPEVDPSSEPRPGPSTLLPSHATHVALPPVPEEEEGVTSAQTLARPSRKRKQADRGDGEATTAGPSRTTRASTRTKIASAAGPSAEPPPRKPSRRAPPRAATGKAAPPPSQPKRERAAPATRPTAPTRGHPPRARVVENAPAPDTAPDDGEPDEEPRQSKKRRVETKPNPQQGGRVLRPRKR